MVLNIKFFFQGTVNTNFRPGQRLIQNIYIRQTTFWLYEFYLIVLTIHDIFDALVLGHGIFPNTWYYSHSSSRYNFLQLDRRRVLPHFFCSHTSIYSRLEQTFIFSELLESVSCNSEIFQNYQKILCEDKTDKDTYIQWSSAIRRTKEYFQTWI